ncbi:MAG: RNA methyltransferase [candidate division KSB1 bacterium]|nr:RNA methyltransferase [candidate division KSB1 bacterium]MDZ7335423.1 RNA methyltransferase [candidate division KSB1 bacterium]MDZ7358590.1 RNA methyltransferase [candidate division KSB1 bacterium]MDZ7375366.1 RNA methyltransferase [candidate division KSB1 bacterium]MDZ7401168.1 RNA methyltransferase [candidate division KSB1 bacterium]
MLSKARFNYILSLKRKKYRETHRKFLVEGYHLCTEAIRSDFEVETLLIAPELLAKEKYTDLLNLASLKAIKVEKIEALDVRKLADTVNSQGIFAIVEQKKFHLDDVIRSGFEFGIVIDAGQDPGNLGTIIRTCDWFGVSAIFLGKGTVELFNPKVVRSTMGSIFHLPIVEQLDLCDWLPRMKQLGYSIFGADVNGTYAYHQVTYPRPLLMVIGNEHHGIRPKLYPYFDKLVKIPSYGKAESLNMAVAAALIISRIIN